MFADALRTKCENNMETSAISEMFEVDESHPWYKARLVLIERLIQKIANQNSKILDFGCGSGAVAGYLKSFGYKNIEGVDVSQACVERTKARGIKAGKININLSSLPSSKYEIIMLLDVLEHVKNDKALLQLLKKFLDLNGQMLITVPAHKLLWRYHDEINLHFRRYSKKELSKLINDSGFEIKYIRWWNSFLFPVFLTNSFLERIFRITLNKKNINGIGFKSPPSLCSSMLLKILSFESRNQIVGRFVGVSLVAVISVK